MKSKYRILVLALVLLFLFTACTPAEETAVEEPEIEKLRIAVVSPSAINDFAFTQSIL